MSCIAGDWQTCEAGTVVTCEKGHEIFVLKSRVGYGDTPNNFKDIQKDWVDWRQEKNVADQPSPSKCTTCEANYSRWVKTWLGDFLVVHTERGWGPHVK